MKTPRLPQMLWFLLALGFAMRVGVIWLRPPGTLLLAPDEPEYLAIAESVADGYGFTIYGDTTAYRDMLFPTIAGEMIALFKTEYAVFALLVLLDLATALLLFVLARRCFTEEIALLTAGAWLLYPAAILFTALFLTETLFVFLSVLALFLFLPAVSGGARGGARHGIALGVVLGLLLLTRATGVILAASILVMLLYRRRIGQVLIVTATMLVVILPWMLRNAKLFDAFALNTNSGINFYIGNNPHATGAYRFDDAVADTLNSVAGEVKRNALATTLAVDYIGSRPLSAAKLWPKKFAYLWSTDMAMWAHYLPKPDSPSLAATLRTVPVLLLALTVLYYAAIVVLGMSGLALNAAFPLRGVLMLQLALTTLSALVTYGLPRYHFPLMPALLLGGAALIAALPRPAQIIRKPVLLLLLVLFLGVWMAEILTIAGA